MTPRHRGANPDSAVNDAARRRYLELSGAAG